MQPRGDNLAHAPQPERRRIRVRGLVQGVGFRPHVFRCAARFGVTGFVGNGPEGVVIEAQGEAIDLFTSDAQVLVRSSSEGHAVCVSRRGSAQLIG